MKKQETTVYLREPENSWEVSYVINWKRPEIRTGITIEELIRYIPEVRRKQLRAWAEEKYESRWLREHTLPRVRKKQLG